MISYRSKNFKKLFAQLPTHIQRLAEKNFALWRQNPWHPSLNFKELEPNRWSVRVGKDYRALGIRDGNDLIWTWIGPHETYNNLLARR